MDLEDEDVKPFTKVPPGLEAFFAAQNMRSAGDNEGVRRGWLECTGWEWKGNEVEYEFQFDKMRLFVTSTDGSDKKGKRMCIPQIKEKVEEIRKALAPHMKKNGVGAK
ncbi:uncharacterized protein LOC120668918 isoform X2 [Panicum virgatum]|uniref:uncharacterized protein LOC120668918 isoform X2 n=1 Tax=Panicum virgatum TaxID=38727 RepID=UPI0019D5C934|nr:uncharacterized protein LOC120668918 isoform X2 [Panicum virgatum]